MRRSQAPSALRAKHGDGDSVGGAPWSVGSGGTGGCGWLGGHGSGASKTQASGTPSSSSASTATLLPAAQRITQYKVRSQCLSSCTAGAHRKHMHARLLCMPRGDITPNRM
jgi:hypothetical protein